MQPGGRRRRSKAETVKTITRDAEFRDFFARENERLQRFATMLVGDPHQGAELAQEALVRVYKKWGRVRDGSPGAYARSTIVNLVRSAHRYNKIRRERPLPTAPDSVESQAGRVDDWLRVSAALNRLSPVRRATILLRFYEDMSEHEIARALDRPLGTVKSDIHRALRQLRPLLEESRAGEPR
jgi:RNA polymerase sigma-70 factor (sigma-E family)